MAQRTGEIFSGGGGGVGVEIRVVLHNVIGETEVFLGFSSSVKMTTRW